MNAVPESRTSNTERRLPNRLFALWACGALACCSCATLPPATVHTDSLREDMPTAKVETASGNDAATAGSVRISARPKSEIQQVAYQEPYCPPEVGSACPPDAILSSPPEPRMPVAGPNPYAVGMPAVEAVALTSPGLYPDEYLCDGGDRNLPVHYSENERYGLETEDTVAEYVDHKGAERMNPSTKTCVYAPRFAAIRTISQPVLGDHLNRSVGMINSAGEGELRNRMAGTQGVKQEMLGGVRMRSRASGMESEEIGLGVAQDVAAVHHDKINNLFQNFTFAELFKLDQLTAARLNYGLQAAVTWSREASPIITAQIESPVEGLIELSATALTVIDDKPSDVPGVLQLAKFADKHEAKPGDVITFTLRYRNAGPREVHYVRIVDNLTPRLAFVANSVTSDRDGELTTEDNGEGSQVLTFALSESLPAGAGGTITFQATVR
jgi:uncharacterized repeat protein (TIGR01451 family)